MRRLLVLCALAVAGCNEQPNDASAQMAGLDERAIAGTCPEGTTDDRWADCVEGFDPGAEADFGHDALPAIVLGPPVVNEAGGSLDVVSLGCGGSITLAFDPPGIIDGPGADLVVYENAFPTGETTFAEPARVLVSSDGEDWRPFDCALSADAAWPPHGCAGVTPSSDGGDRFDLADVSLDHARYVRLVDVSLAFYGHDMWCTGGAGGFDLDAVGAVQR